MKNLLKPTTLVLLMSFTLSSATQAFSAIPVNVTVEKSNEAETQRLTNRLAEIKATDVSTMTRKQKRELRDEVKSIKHQLKTNANSGGVYISVGAAIIIILLLIILL
jgi:Skp family chaperone for outer membrane proteins